MTQLFRKMEAMLYEKIIHITMIYNLLFLFHVENEAYGIIIACLYMCLSILNYLFCVQCTITTWWQHIICICYFILC